MATSKKTSKVRRQKAAPKKVAPKSRASKAAATKRAGATTVSRGEELLRALVTAAAGAKSPIGEPRPLDADAIRAFEVAAGVAMSPSLHALLSFDAGHMERQFDWFDARGRFLAKPTFEVIAAHAGGFAEAYEPLCAARFPGKAIALDQGSDSMRLLYFGDPDALGEYPVLFIDHDDLPVLGVECAGFDIYAARLFGLEVTGSAALAKARAQQLLGTSEWEFMSETELPPPRPGPSPHSVAHAAVAGPGPGDGKKPRKLSDKQLDQALVERAREGELVRLAELVRDAAQRKRPQRALDDALLGALDGEKAAALSLLLAAGASPKAEDHYGCALARLRGGDGAPALVRLLLAAGADPNGPSVNGETALHWAVKHGTLEHVRLLLEAGGDPNGGTDTLTPLHIDRDASGTVPVPEMVDLLIKHGGDPNGAGKAHSPLHAALEDGLLLHAERLLANGADPNLGAERAYLKATPLHVVFERGGDAFVPKLLAAGADRTRKDARGISFEAVYGPRGEDVRPISVHYVASKKPQRVVIDARFAVLNHFQVEAANFAFDPGKWIGLVKHGLAGGAVFAPGTSRLVVESDQPFKALKSGGYVNRRYVLSCSAIAPEFLHVIGQTLLGASIAWTGAGVQHTLRGVSLEIRGDVSGPTEVDGETLREWLARGFRPAPFAEPPPFTLEVVPGNAAITLQTKAGVAQATPRRGPAAADRCAAYLAAWLAMQPYWRPRSGASPIIGLSAEATASSPNTFVLKGFDVQTQRSARGFPFELDAPRALLANALTALHAEVPLERVVWQTGSHVPS